MRPLSMAQQGLWSAYLLNEDRALFNTAECVAFAGRVDAPLLLEALRQSCGECEALAGHYRMEDGTVGFVAAGLTLEIPQLEVPTGVDAEA